MSVVYSGFGVYPFMVGGSGGDIYRTWTSPLMGMDIEVGLNGRALPQPA